jgi:hypothetical protein
VASRQRVDVPQRVVAAGGGGQDVNELERRTQINRRSIWPPAGTARRTPTHRRNDDPPKIQGVARCRAIRATPGGVVHRRSRVAVCGRGHAGMIGPGGRPLPRPKVPTGRGCPGSACPLLALGRTGGGLGTFGSRAPALGDARSRRPNHRHLGGAMVGITRVRENGARPRPLKEPRRKLGLWMATALVVGNMVGSGPTRCGPSPVPATRWSSGASCSCWRACRCTCS